MRPQSLLPSTNAAAALAAAAGAGPYFVIEPLPQDAARQPPASQPLGCQPPAWQPPGWQPLSLLIGDQDVLAERVARARAAIAAGAGLAPADVSERVAASIVFLGLASRLVSPSLAATVLGGVVPELTVSSLWWRPVDGGPWPLAAGAVHGREVGDLAAEGDLGEAAVLLSEGCARGVAGPVSEAFQSLFRLSPLVLRGNVASALAGAAGMLAETFPDRAEAAGRLTARVLALEPLAGAGELVQPDASRPRRFLVRRSCCLFYRVPGAGICGDCVLTPEHVRRQQWQSALGR